VLVLFLIISVFILYSLKNVNVASSEFTGLGIKSLPSILIYAIFNTSLPEEILFRGFLLKRIKNLIKKSVVTFEKLQHLKKED